MKIYRVHVLHPLEPRQRAHTVRMYRVGAKSPEDAIKAVRNRLDEFERPGLTIIKCSEFGEVDGVVYDGACSIDPEQAAQLEAL